MSLWRPSHLLLVRARAGGPEACVEIMMAPHRITDAVGTAAYTEAEWQAQIQPEWARTRSGQWLRRHQGRMVAFQGTVQVVPIPEFTREATGIPQRFLLVDDDPHVAQALARAVRARTKAWMPVIAKDAAEALELAEVVPMNGIVADRAMPDMDGRELLLEFRRRHPQSARILLTGSGSVSDFEAAHKVLRKPCPASIVLVILDAVMKSAA
jgi:CheY-like chemotaxis protein